MYHNGNSRHENTTDVKVLRDEGFFQSRGSVLRGCILHISIISELSLHLLTVLSATLTKYPPYLRNQKECLIKTSPPRRASERP